MLALGSLADIEFDHLSFGKRLVTFTQDVGVMDEEVLSTCFRCDKALPFLVVKPFNGTFLL